MPGHSLVWFEPVGPEKVGRAIVIVSLDNLVCGSLVWIRSEMLCLQSLSCEVPWGSVVSPLLFKIYRKPHWVRSFVIMG